MNMDNGNYYKGKSKSTITAFKNKCWEEFKVAFEELNNLKKKYDVVVDDMCCIIRICPMEHLKFFLISLTKKIVYFIARCRLMINGKCIRKFQMEAETGYLLSEKQIDLVGSYEEETSCTFPLTIRCSQAMKYLEVTTTDEIRNLDFDSKIRTIAEYIRQSQAHFEVDMSNAVYYKQGIKKTDLTFLIKSEQRVHVVLTTPYLQKHPELDNNPIVWKTTVNDEEGLKLFENRFAMVGKNILTGLLASPKSDGKEVVLWDCVSALKEYRQETTSVADEPAEDSSTNVSITQEGVSGVDSMDIEATNTKLGIGSRKPFLSNRPNSISAVLADNSFSSGITDESSNLTDTTNYPSPSIEGSDCEGNMSKAKRSYNNRKNKKSGYCDTADIFDHDATWYREKESEVEKDTAFPGKKRQRDNGIFAVKSGHANDTRFEQEADSDDDVIYGGRKKSIREVMNAAVKKRLSNKERATDEEHKNEQEYNVAFHKKPLTKTEDFVDAIVMELNDDCNISEAVKSLSQKSTLSFSLTPPAPVQVESNLCSSVHQLLYSNIKTEEELAAVNLELDNGFFIKLTCHSTLSVAAELSLERYMLGYVIRKGILNGVQQFEKQIITNWNEIFESIELLITQRLNKEASDSNMRLSDAYYAATRSNHAELKLQQRLLDESSTQEGDLDDIYSAKSAQLRRDFDSAQATLKGGHENILKLTKNIQLNVSRSIARTLHGVAERVCYLWGKLNGCLGELLEPEQIKKYSKKCADRDVLENALNFNASERVSLSHSSNSSPLAARLVESSQEALLTTAGGKEDIQKNGEDNSEELLLNSSSEHSQPLLPVARGNVEKSHIEQLEDAVRQIKVDKNLMKQFSQIIYAKAPAQTTFVTAKITASKKKTKASTAVPAVTVVASTAPVVEAQPLLPPASEASKAIMRNFLTGSGTTASSYSGGPVARVQLPAAEVIDQALKSYDDVARIILTNVFGSTDNAMLRLDYKDKQNQVEMLKRLRLLQFLMTNKHHEVSEVMEEFIQHEDFLSMFSCAFYLKVPTGTSGATIRKDGYCFYRSIFQLYFSEKYDEYSRTLVQMMQDDMERNKKPSNGVHVEDEFYHFVCDLENMSRRLSPIFAAHYDEVTLFKFLADVRMLRILLKHKPGVGIPKELWGNQLFVVLLQFNVTGWRIISDADRPALDNRLTEQGKIGSWMQYQHTSLFTPAIASSKGLLTFGVLTELCSVTPNFICFDGMCHFFVLENPSQAAFTEQVRVTKHLVLARLLEGVKLIANGESFLEVVDQIVVSLETGSSREVMSFNVAEFDEAFSAKFPYIPSDKSKMIDFSLDSDPDLPDAERKLMEKVRVLEGKAKIINYHNNLLRDLLLPGAGIKID